LVFSGLQALDANLRWDDTQNQAILSLCVRDREDQEAAIPGRTFQ